jgi:catechol 2,3-dioxygenase-like lactoylglutathione lyase family enzyme
MQAPSNGGTRMRDLPRRCEQDIERAAALAAIVAAPARESQAMYSHATVGSNDLERSRRFYDAVFGAVGGKPGMEDPKGRVIYAHKGGLLIVTRPIDGEPASNGNGITLGLVMDSPEEADAWHKAGVENGGTAIEDPPGVREMGPTRLYLAYLRDPDGNKLCATHRMG